MFKPIVLKQGNKAIVVSCGKEDGPAFHAPVEEMIDELIAKYQISWSGHTSII